MITNRNDTVNATLTITGGGFKEPVWVDAITGGVYAIPKEKIVYLSPPDPVINYDEDIRQIQMGQVEQTIVQDDYDSRLTRLENRKQAVATVQQPWMTDEKRAKLEKVLSQ